jgi:hypothetical protein
VRLASSKSSRARRSRAGVVLAAAVIGLATLALRPAPACAQLFTRPNEEFRSPKRYALELRFGPYSPRVDDEFSSDRHPHQDFFGTSRRLMTQVEFDYQFLTQFGSAALGFSLGYFAEKGQARIENGLDNAVAEESGDETKLSMFPAAVLLVYRADQLWRSLRIPLVPYGKIGLSYTLWSVFNGNDQVARGETLGLSGRGRGGTRGWQAAAGLSLALDFIDPGSARELDAETGVNHTYIFAEWDKYSISGLGQSGRLNVGDSTWVAGLMFEF